MIVDGSRYRYDGAEQDRTVIFMHIPKTGGDTLNQILERQYQPEHIYSMLYEPSTIKADIFRRMSADRREEIRLLRGHMSFGIHQYLAGPFTYFTLLRQPIERVISLYYFILRTPKHYLHEIITSENMSLLTCLKNEISIVLDNAQTRMVSGVNGEPGFGECNEQTLETAKKNLREYFAVVGLTGRFDETLLMLQKAFGWRDIFYTRRHVAKKRPRKENLSQDTLDALEKTQQLDIALYQYAQMLFEEQIGQQGPTFAARVKAFQLRNWLDPIYWKIKKQLVGSPLRQGTHKAHIVMNELPSVIRLGQKVAILATVTNAGDTLWFGTARGFENRVIFGVRLYLPDGQPLMPDGLEWRAIGHNVGPGESIQVKYDLRLPKSLAPGDYVLQFDMVEEYTAWFQQFGSPVVEHRFTLVE